MARVEPDASNALLAPSLAPPRAAVIYPVLPDDELETPSLPREHPPWVKDALAVSHRAKEWIARLKPIALRVLTFWDHRLRGIVVGGRRLDVDASGSYRIGS